MPPLARSRKQGSRTSVSQLCQTCERHTTNSPNQFRFSTCQRMAKRCGMLQGSSMILTQPKSRINWPFCLSKNWNEQAAPMKCSKSSPFTINCSCAPKFEVLSPSTSLNSLLKCCLTSTNSRWKFWTKTNTTTLWTLREISLRLFKRSPGSTNYRRNSSFTKIVWRKSLVKIGRPNRKEPTWRRLVSSWQLDCSVHRRSILMTGITM